MMKTRLLTSLITLVIFLCMAHPCFSVSGREMVVVFKGDHTEVLFEEENGAITKLRPPGFRAPAFVGGIFKGKEFLVVLSSARYNSNLGKSVIEAAARTSYGDYTKWSDAESIAKYTRKSRKNSVVGDLTAVMKGNKIYVLAPSWDESKVDWTHHTSNTGWNPLMIVGTMKDQNKDGSPGAHVEWQKSVSLKELLPKSVLGAPGFQFIGGVGNGVVTKNGTIVFPIQIINTAKKYASSIIYSTDDGSTWHMGGSTEHGPTECSVAEWGNGKLLLSTRYDGGFRNAYESDDMGTTWKESTMFSRVWGNQLDRRGVGSQGSLITVPVDGKDVLLFSHPLNKRGGYKRDTLQLWMSDGQRIKCVGTISEKGKGEHSGNSILAHVGDNIYIVHEINPFGEWDNDDAPLKEWDRVIALTPLPDLFKSVKNRVRGWRQLDKELKKIHVPTSGILGFLSDSNDDTVWKDKYNCVHATVNGGTRVEGGFRFDGTPGSGAQWPVQSQGQNQFYIFTKKQFTLAATVTIHSANEAGDHLLLGASMNAQGKSVMIGLWYRQDKKWYFMDTDGVLLHTGVSFELEKEYHVAISYADRTLSVTLDGAVIRRRRRQYYREDYIKYFFMGGIGKSLTEKGCLCTVKNVMLFNRVLNQSEVTKTENVVNYVNLKESTSTKTFTVTLEDSKLSSMMDTQKTADPGAHIIPIEDVDDESEISNSMDSESSAENPTSDDNDCDEDSNDFRRHSNDGKSNKEHKRVDGAFVTFSFTARLCFFSSAIVLTWL